MSTPGRPKGEYRSAQHEGTPVSGQPIREQALAFGCQGEQLVGVVSQPLKPAVDLALVVVVGGPQVRSGSHRQFTQLCRAVAAAGVPALRFDVRGMGDSSGPLHGFEDLADDIGAAIDALQAHLPQVRRVVLWGLCDGASAALLHAQRRADARVAGTVILNPWVRSEATLAQAQLKHYYRDRLRQPEFWKKLLGGGVALRALRDLWANLRAARGTGATRAAVTPSAAPFQERILQGAERRAGALLLVLSGKDHTAREFETLVGQQPRWQAVLKGPRASTCRLPDADHTFSDSKDKARLEAVTVSWLAELLGRPT
jgi:uncharacterized protein